VPTSPSSRSVCEPSADPASPARRFDTHDAVYVRPVGHSAGGQLTVWAASQGRPDRGGPSAVTFTGCVCLAGVLDLSEASRLRAGRVPGRLRPRLDDRIVPREQSTAYVAAAEAVGAPVSFHEVPGDHSAVVDPTSDAWDTVIGLIGDRATTGRRAVTRRRSRAPGGSVRGSSSWWRVAMP